MNRDEIIRAIQEAPLSEHDLQEILKALMQKMVGEAIVSAAIDLTGWAVKEEKHGD